MNFLNQLAQTRPFSVGINLARYAEVLDRWHVNQKASWQSDVRSNARAFFSNRLFGDLHKNFLTFVQQFADGDLLAFMTWLTSTSALRSWPASSARSRLGGFTVSSFAWRIVRGHLLSSGFCLLRLSGLDGSSFFVLSICAVGVRSGGRFRRAPSTSSAPARRKLFMRTTGSDAGFGVCIYFAGSFRLRFADRTRLFLIGLLRFEEPADHARLLAGTRARTRRRHFCGCFEGC